MPPEGRKTVKKLDAGTRSPKANSSLRTSGTMKSAKTASGPKSSRISKPKAGSRAPKSPSKSPEGAERQERAPREPRGGGGKVKVKLQIKFAVCIMIIVAILLLLLGFSVGNSAQSSVSDQIQKRGYAALKMSIAYGDEYVLQYATGVHEYNTTMQRITQALKAIKAKQDGGEKLTEEERSEYENWLKEQNNVKANWDKEKELIINRFSNRLKQATKNDSGKSHGALLNVIVNIPKYGAISAYPALEVKGESYNFPLDSTVTLRKGPLTLGDGKVVDGWSFIKKFEVTNPIGGNTLEATAITVLSAGRIQEIKSQLTRSIIMVVIFGMVIGVVAALFLANIITKPVSQLVGDIEVVARGNLNHRTLARSNDEIGLLAHTFDVMTRNLNIAHKAEVENKAREHELGIAQEIQANLLPKKIPQIPGYDLGCFYLPSKEVGGDYYDYIQIDDTHLGVIVADVSGKGIPGSMVMTMARSLIRYEAQNNLDPVDTFIKVNRILAKDIRRGMFVTAMYLILDMKTGKMQVASAGHNPMMVFRDQTKKVEEINPNGIALGFDKGPIFERTIKAEEIRLQRGDRLALYTDGVVEAMSPDNEEFGEEKFYQLCELHSHLTSSQYINLIVKALEKHKADAPQSDDITISTLKMLK